MALLRLIAKLEVKGNNVVKPISFEGLRVVGQPEELAVRYAEGGADEIIFYDLATLYGRNQLGPLLERTTANVFIPVTVAGGVRSIDDVKRLLGSGADKVAINTAAIRDPSLISQCANRVGCQAVVVSIEAKKNRSGWEAYTDNGRERTGRDAVAWAKEAVERGAGEILLTSIDRDGTRKGCDCELVAAVAPHVSVPVIACGGVGSVFHVEQVISEGRADAVAMASYLHKGGSIAGLRAELVKKSPD